MKQSQSNNIKNNINLIEFNKNIYKNYSIKIDYNFDEVNKFLNINYYFVGDYKQINFNNNLIFQNTYENRKDNLWQHSCCEVFIKNKHNSNNFYREFNFSFAGAWACYDFVDYRKAAGIPKPNFENNFPIIKVIENANKDKILNVKIPFAMLLDFNNFDDLTLHFCAVVKELTNDNLYYYADQHLDNNKADFHKF